MNNIQDNKLSMYYSVQKTCNKYQTVWNAVPGFVNGFSAFESRIAEIETAHRKQLRKSTGVTLDKKAMKAAMTEKALIIAGAGYAYASEEKNFTLKQVFDLSKRDLSNVRDEVVLRTCEGVLSAAQPIITPLTDAGLDAADLTELDDMIDSFSELIVAPREVISERKSATSELEILFETCDALLKEKLDKMALKFNATHAEFFRFYTNSRIIVDLGTRHEAEDEGDAQSPAVA